MTAAITHRRVLAIAIPIVISNATVPILGAVDTFAVGQMGTAEPIGAVGLGAVLLSTLYWLFGFLRMATTGLAAQAHGRSDEAEVAALLIRGVMIGVGAGIILIVGQWAIFPVAFSVSPASAEVEALTRDYVGIRIWSAPAAIGLYAISGWLIALERTRDVLIVQLLVNGLNAALNLWFVLELGWGVKGVAWATFIAEWSGLALGLWLCRDWLAARYMRNVAALLDPARLRQFGGVSTDILIRSLFLQLIFTSFLFYGSGLGDTTLAANQVLMQFVTITAYTMDGFAFAAESLVGQAVGARNRADFRRSAVLSSLWAGVLMIALSALFVLAGPWFIDLLTKAPDVQTAAREYLPWLIAIPLIGIGPFMLDGIFIGATRTRDMRNMMALSFACYAAAVGVLLPVFENHGLWAALTISFIARGVTLGWLYPRLEQSVADAPA
ncbi:MAG: MATE family efflux transporter [Pseudomonadota bacterium]